jgi:carboxypeptidase family protein
VRLKLTVFVCFLALATLASSQEFRASISGHIFDKTGARVPQARIQAIDVANGDVTNATTDTSGVYNIPLLKPGRYRLTVTAPGFKQYIRENITLDVSQAAGIDVTLELGDVTQSVEVTAEAALLDTENANRAGLIDSTSVAELPLNSGRNPFMLGLTASGVTFRGASIWQRPFDNGAIADWVVNGSWQSNNEFLLDGAPNNAQMGSNNIAYVPITDTVQEFTMMQNTYDPEYGHTMGGILNTVGKSGGSKFHGDGWEFLRRAALDANTFQANSQGAPRAAHYLDDYGGMVSGQVVIPKLLKRDGWAKLFYLGAYQGYREGTADPLYDNVPTMAMRSGDFSNFKTGTGQLIPIYDPLTASYDSVGNIVNNRQPFPGNIIPSNRIDPVAKAVSSYYMAPNATTAGQQTGVDDLILSDVVDADRYYNMNIRFDWNFGDKHRVFISEGSNDRTEKRPVNGIVGVGEDGQLPFQRINDRYVLDWTWTATPTMVVDIRAANNRFIEKGTGQANLGFDLTSLGLPKSLVSQLPQPAYFGYWNVSGYNALGRYLSDNITNYYGLEANVTKTWKSHTFKFGLDLRRNQYIIDDQGNILEVDSTSSFTQYAFNNNLNPANQVTGDGYASFLLGNPSGGSSNYPADPFFRQWYAGMYFKDDWRVNSRLTVNWGARYDINAPPDEKYNRLDANFNPNVTSPIGAMAAANIAKLNLQIPAQFASLYSNLASLKGSMEFAGTNGYSNKAANTDWTGIQPRLGFAYRLKEKLVARGGYGMYIPNPSNDWLITNGFSTNTSMVVSNDSNRTPIQGVMENPYPSGISAPPGSSQGALTYAGKSVNYFNPDFRLARSHQFSFGLEYQVSRTSTLDASYVGNRVSHTQSNYPFDLAPSSWYNSCSVMYGASTPAGFSTPAQYCQQSVPNPFQGLAPFIGTSMYTAPTISLQQMERPFPQFTGGTEYGLSTGHVWYNSMQINYNYRVANGLTVLANYTLSKQNEKWGYLNYYQQPVQYQEGLYYADRPHFIKLTVVYQLPFGRGKHFLANTNGLASRVVSGWEVNTFITDSPEGEPINLPNGTIPLGNPSAIAGGTFTPGNVQWGASKVQLFNNCSLQESDSGVVTPTAQALANGCSPTNFSQYAWLSLPPNYRPNQTNSYRAGNIRLQGTYTADASVTKMTHINERIGLQFRAEAFNLFNHWNYMLANLNSTTPTSVNFGSIIPSTLSTQASVNPRSIQLGFKVLW